MNLQQSATFGEYVRRAREKLGWSLKKVSEQSGGPNDGISDAHLSRIENDFYPGTSLKRKTLRAIARGLRLPFAEVEAQAYGHPMSEPDAREVRLLTLFRQLTVEGQDTFFDLGHVVLKRHAVTPTHSIAARKGARTEAKPKKRVA